jgi:hypothetical protein
VVSIDATEIFKISSAENTPKLTYSISLISEAKSILPKK